MTDRALNTLQIFDMDGKYLETLTGYGLPVNMDTWKDLMVVPELKARVALLDTKNQAVVRWETMWKPSTPMERSERTVTSGSTVNLCVRMTPVSVRTESVCGRVGTGRVTKLKRM